MQQKKWTNLIEDLDWETLHEFKFCDLENEIAKAKKNIFFSREIC